MNRRNFIQVFGLGIGAVSLSSTIAGCTVTETTDDYGWNGPGPQQKDIRMQVLSYAILSPNPHNIQPWIVRLTGDKSFDLYVDPARLLPATDPFYRQIHVSQGTFLETLSIAATGFGHEATIDYFPQGIYGNQELLNKPIASIELIPRTDLSPDPLFAHLLTRHSNKREYDNRRLTEAEINTLRDFHGSDNSYPLSIVQSTEAKQQFEQILTKGMQIEVGDKGRDHETISMFRFNDDEVKQYRDGFGVSQAGLSGMKKLIVENFVLSRESVEKDPTAFGEQAVDITRKAAASTATFAWISTPGNSRLDQVKAGRDYCRINLKTTAMRLAQHPMSQVLQEFDEMLPLQARFKKQFAIKDSDTVQMLFRLGRAEATPHGPRRLVSELIRS
ncbi:Acg family FMN-binding oxidoreductase [Amphritea sp. HPY]|uniref:Acg family FMN-binding oxidoreductase n=1 Tax=Amphritea sp. HPY TaxID=3421652 RepID=UPI003D7F144F